MNTFFTADTHFGHGNIIKYCSRPFKNAPEMDMALINNWNKVVSPKDTVYHLGDFSYGDIYYAKETIMELNGNIKFIFGNHDKAIKALQNDIRYNSNEHYELNKKFKILGNLVEIKVEDQPITLCHYAMRVWNKSHYGAWHLYGHSHGSLPDDPHSRSIDVGVDCHGYRPIAFEEVSIYMSKKLFIPIDHHEGDARKESGGIGLSREEYTQKQRRIQYEQLKKEFETV